MLLHLTPRTDATTASVLAEKDLLAELVAGLGSPLNVVLPQRLAANVAAFRDVYSRHRLAGQIYYAHKANRSTALVRELAVTDAGIDVASAGELEHALAAGFGPDRIVATGPKNPAYLHLAARVGALIGVDSLAELGACPPARVLLRLSGFSSTGTRVGSRRSRFGIPAAELTTALDLVEKGALDLVGVAFHLDTVELSEKAVALEGCLVALDECRRRGLRPWTVDIGGGFGVDYLADGAQWDAWTAALTGAVLGTRAPLTWDGHGYGLRAEGGTIRGALQLYPAHRPLSGAAYLDRLLSTDAPAARRPLGAMLLDSMGDLVVEPGRALLDQCGLTLATVLEVRDEPGGDTVIRLDANARDISLEEHGVQMDPIVLHLEEPAERGPVEAYLFGNLCLEADLITRRRVALPSRPRAGDLLAFVNTAGYLMDFSAGRALRQPVARTVVLHRTGNAWRWCLDERYRPEAAA